MTLREKGKVVKLFGKAAPREKGCFFSFKKHIPPLIKQKKSLPLQSQKLSACLSSTACPQHPHTNRLWDRQPRSVPET